MIQGRRRGRDPTGCNTLLPAGKSARAWTSVLLPSDSHIRPNHLSRHIFRPQQHLDRDKTLLAVVSIPKKKLLQSFSGKFLNRSFAWRFWRLQCTRFSEAVGRLTWRIRKVCQKAQFAFQGFRFENVLHASDLPHRGLSSNPLGEATL
jgi:hypothetical protein